MASDFQVEDFISEARDRFDFGRTADAEDRERAEADNRFANADDKDLGQWDDVSKRKRRNRPVLQWNRIPTYVQTVVNDGRQNKPSIRISPDDGGTQHTADYLQARIRHIEYETNADTAKDTAREQQVTSGRGFMRVRTEYIPGTFDQRIAIERIENQFAVVFDPAAVEYDRSDAEWCFVISQISKDAHERKYGKKSLVNRLDFAEAVKLAPEWIGLGAQGQLIQIAEYYVKEYRDRTLSELGSTALPVWKDEIGEATYADLKQRGLILRERVEPSPVIIQYVINGAEVLDKTEWIGSTIPIIPFWGREAVVDGKRRTYSLVRNTRHPQMLVNLYVSNIAELIGQIPKTPHKVPVGGIPAGSEGDWKNVNNHPLAYLLYEAYDAQGRPIPPPVREMGEPPIQALSLGLNQAIDAIKAAMGIYDAAIGAVSNETSGVAIERRRKASNITNYHFPDNEARSNKYLGEILVEIVPKLEKAGKSYPIRTEDGKTHMVPIGVEHRDWKTGNIVTHDLRSGQYGVNVSTGPSYLSQREDAYDRDVALVQADPELMWVIGDQMFAADDTAGSEERAERMKRAIAMKSPGLLEEDKNQQAVPPQVQQQLVGLQQELQKAHAFAQSLHDQLQSKQPELANQLKIKQMDLDFQREKLTVEAEGLRLKVSSAEAVEELRQQVSTLMHERQLFMDQQAQVADQQQRADLANQAAQLAQQQPPPSDPGMQPEAGQ